ncbi:cytochrome P450 [Pseudoruegeria sp. HB172150]|uniref:cytochrome P450 n=1 Tax=Pseudoruegeria sp. HB172150 TaxID=2721164 RepID=UPI0015552F78|nr:cytochrome P450 [Pseudoruegeria sp. HB172150]
MNKVVPFGADGASALFVDPLTLSQNPHAMFAGLRDHYPVIEVGEQQYLALRGEDVLSLLTDSRTVQIEGADYARLNRVPEGAVSRLMSDFFLFSNGKTHRTLRSLFARSFAHRAIEASRGQVRAKAAAIVAELPRGESFDFVEAMASRMPAEMIALILGLPESDAPYFTTLVYETTRAVVPPYPLDHHSVIEAATAELFFYVEEHLLRRLDEPCDDMLSMLVTDWQENRVIPFDSLVNQVIGIVIAGSDTTRAGFAMLTTLLLQHPEQWEMLRGEPSLLPGAVAEGLRYEPPAASVPRFTVAPVEIAGVTLPAGVMLSASTMSALRDPALYADPDRFDITRTDHPKLHSVFGLGPHRCIGDVLSRIELEESLAALIAGAPDIELEVAPKLQGYRSLRRITPMQVRIP